MAEAQPDCRRRGEAAFPTESGERVILIHGEGVESTLPAAGASGGAFAGKVLIDCTNPVDGERFTLVTGEGHSIAEANQSRSGPSIVRASSRQWRPP